MTYSLLKITIRYFETNGIHTNELTKGWTEINHRA